LSEPPFGLGQFIWCRFPYMEKPLRPGPKEHIGYIADIRELGEDAHLAVMSIYTTTVPWEPRMRLPLGVIPVEPSAAAAMNQKGFVIDARRIAFMPVSLAFFPRLGKPNKGIVHTASPRFHRLVQNTLLQLARRPDLIVALGPDRPGQVRRKRDA